MGQIVVRRAADTAGVFRRIKVLIDGDVVASLKPQEQKSIDVVAGPHTVRAKMDWCGSERLQVSVAGDAPIEVEVSLPWSGILAGFFAPRTALLAKLV